MTESHAGSDVRSMRATAVKTADGYLINGTKAFVTTGDAADVLTIFLKVEKSKRENSSPNALRNAVAGNLPPTCI